MKTFMAIPYDKEISNFSKDFKVPSDIEGHEVFVKLYDNTNIKKTLGLDKISIVRDLIAKEFMESDCKKLILIDSDIICEGKNLIHLVESDDEICMNTMFPRIKRPRMKYYSEKTKTLYGHTACTAIKRSVFEKLTPPYFRYKDYECMWEKGSYEDNHFYRNCKDAGIEVYRYPVIVGHQCRRTGEIYREYREVYT